MYLAEALIDNQYIRELDISLNAIGKPGFHAIWDVINTTKIEVLKCSKNSFLGDDTMQFFASVLEDTGKCCIKKFDFSSCRLNDQSLI